MNSAGRTDSDTKVSSIPLSNCFGSGLLVLWHSRIRIGQDVQKGIGNDSSGTSKNILVGNQRREGPEIRRPDFSSTPHRHSLSHNWRFCV
jgi:hypothetical protein